MSFPIAIRVLSSSIDQSDPVRLELYSPEQSTNDSPETGIASGDWVCAYRITRGTRVLVTGQAVGADSLQAIVNAISQLRGRCAQSAVEATYDGEAVGSGLPEYLPQGFGHEFERHLHELVAHEVELHAQALKEKHERTMGPRKGAP